MGAGKTTALKNFLTSYVSSEQRVLLTTGRIQQALSLIGGLADMDIETGQRVSKLIASDGKPFRLFFYKNKEEVLSSDGPGLYICQWESLHCLLSTKDSMYKSFDYVISDEIRATLSQSCVSVTNKDFLRTNMHLFRDVCSKSRCLFFDADLLIDHMVERFSLKRLGGIWEDNEIRLEIYTYQSMERRLVLTDDNFMFTELLASKVREARTTRETTGRSTPVFVVCRSKRGMSDLLVLLTGSAKPDFMCNNIAFFSSESSDETMKAWENIDGFISSNSVDVILTTSKVTVCADMNNPVTACFILSNSHGGCHVRDLFQTIGRARSPTTPDITTLITTPRDSPGKEPEFLDIKEAMVVDGRIRREYIQVIQSDIHFDLEDENKFNRLVVKRSPDWMIHLACDTELEIQRNKPGMFHSTILRTASYKGWVVSFNRKQDPEDTDNDPFKEAHEISGKELKARDEMILEELKLKSLEELSVLASTKATSGIDKEKGVIAAFLIRFPSFIPHIDLNMKKYFIANHTVFDRVKYFDQTEEELKAADFKRTLFVFKQKIMERTPIMFPVMEALCGLVMLQLGLDFGDDFINAPIEELDPKKRECENYYIEKSSLEGKYGDIRVLFDKVHSSLGLKRSMRVTEYKDKADGCIKLVGKVFQHFGRKLEGYKHKSRGDLLDQRSYRIVQDINFYMLNPHYEQKEYKKYHTVSGGLAGVIRKAKADNPDLLHIRERPVVQSRTNDKKPRRGKKRTATEMKAPKAKRPDVEFVDVRELRADDISQMNDVQEDSVDREPTGLTQELLGLLATQ